MLTQWRHCGGWGHFSTGRESESARFCWAGWHTVRHDASPRLLDVAVGLELFHAYVLIHDDVIDRSHTRRGRPTLHRVVDSLDEWSAVSAAILLGDMCEAWSAELLGGAGTTAAERVRRMREDVLIGQLLDLLGTEQPFQVIHYKTTQYTVHRPLRIGAAMAGASRDVQDACTAYAEPLGEAFQLLDDLEDVVPDGARPLAPIGDLREGKATVVLELAFELATASQREQLVHLVGDRDLDDAGVRMAQLLIAETGAVDEVRRMIVTRRRRALDALDDAPFHPAGADALRALTDLALPGVREW
ncbi:polyprenyl synthetase family protein [Lentzea tibetensis]|uniref:Polyprenyl synthetase family protein n=1 Tax=Lentzea tibetensis TaxID=2591470 RepID=A0A563EN31_9PSEU|nr:polyprenyl synthetase family protein [Lentzea tibetensis]TWP48501.1 polyprenyl synthetase family protein [Lentzea tibetensis]